MRLRFRLYVENAASHSYDGFRGLILLVGSLEMTDLILIRGWRGRLVMCLLGVGEDI